MISPITSHHPLSCPQLYHHVKTWSSVITVYLLMPGSCVNTEGSIHQVLHRRMTNWLLLRATLSSFGVCCCIQPPTFPQLEVNQWMESQLLSGVTSDLLSPSTPLILIDHGWRGYLPTCTNTASNCLSEFTRSPLPSACPNWLNDGLQVHLQTCSITASKCISEFTRSRSRSASPHSSDPGLQLHLRVHFILVSKCISKLTRLWHQCTSFTSDSTCTEIRCLQRWTARWGVYIWQTLE